MFLSSLGLLDLLLERDPSFEELISSLDLALEEKFFFTFLGDKPLEEEELSYYAHCLAFTPDEGFYNSKVKEKISLNSYLDNYFSPKTQAQAYKAYLLYQLLDLATERPELYSTLFRLDCKLRLGVFFPYENALTNSTKRGWRGAKEMSEGYISLLLLMKITEDRNKNLFRGRPNNNFFSSFEGLTTPSRLYDALKEWSEEITYHPEKFNLSKVERSVLLGELKAITSQGWARELVEKGEKEPLPPAPFVPVQPLGDSFYDFIPYFNEVSL